MKEDTKLIMASNLEVEPCALAHDKPRKAVNYFCQGFGGYQLTLPICQECEDKMVDLDWVLLYCVNCHKSCWVYKPDSNKQYHYEEGEKTKWLPACPYCSDF